MTVRTRPGLIDARANVPQRRRVGKVVPYALAGATLVTTIFAEGVAFAAPDEREQCASSAEEAQQLRDEGKYRRAREQMLVCARNVCPGPIKADCGKWLSELDRDAPTVVFGARDTKGTDLLDVKVSMDGAPIQARLDGKPVLVDSGEHTFKFEDADGTTKEERVLLRAAEKARPIIVTLGGATSGRGNDDKHPPDAPTENRGFDGTLVPPLVVAGVGVIALGSFAIFGLSGKSDVDELQKCKPTCAPDRVDSARAKLRMADVSLGVGIIAAGVATYLFVTRPASPNKGHAGAPSKNVPGIRFDAGALRGGGYATVAGEF